MDIFASNDDLQLLFSRFDKNNNEKIGFIEVRFIKNHNYSLKRKSIQNLL